ncbi:hypothetical protein WME89_05740 [Sorangium sp. So ce321]|uniref:hypothetical protein n=1 Tax=Sorangium sp. So ce321 TaxID=3133300 RepID=UPI003F625DBB
MFHERAAAVIESTEALWSFGMRLSGKVEPIVRLAIGAVTPLGPIVGIFPGVQAVAMRHGPARPGGAGALGGAASPRPRRRAADLTRRGLAVATPQGRQSGTMVTSSASVKVELLEQTDVYVVATWRRLMLLVWRRQASVAGVERSRALFQPWAARQLGGAAFLVVVPPQRTGPPDEATRAAMQRAASAPGGYLKGMATLIEAEGFIAASVRALMMRLQARGTQGLAPNIFRTTAEAAAWVAAVLQDPEVTPEKLEEAIRVAREG